MSLHRLMGFTSAVPDPDAVAAYYAEMGLVGDPVACCNWPTSCCSCPAKAA